MIYTFCDMPSVKQRRSPQLGLRTAGDANSTRPPR